jgi:hypothetical protein
MNEQWDRCFDPGGVQSTPLFICLPIQTLLQQITSVFPDL